MTRARIIGSYAVDHVSRDKHGWPTYFRARCEFEYCTWIGHTTDRVEEAEDEGHDHMMAEHAQPIAETLQSLETRLRELDERLEGVSQRLTRAEQSVSWNNRWS